MLTAQPQSATGIDAASGAPKIATRADERGLHVTLSGAWTTLTVAGVDDAMRKLGEDAPSPAMFIEISGIDRIDTAGAWLVERLAARLAERGVHVAISGASPAAAILMSAVSSAARAKPQPPEGPTSLFLDLFEKVGRAMFDIADDLKVGMHILGATIRGAQMKLGRGHALNPAAIFSHIDKMGIGAIPVVLLMSFIIGAIIAQQGAFQLRYFGAEIFVVDLVGILVLREIGVLLTAIMVAGRSGSAITAELGSMKMREEIDALKVIGLNPIGVLVFPRLVALVVALPLLSVASNLAALVGAALVAWSYSGIAPHAFLDRLHLGIDLTTIFSGLIKAPFMALIIGIIASLEGLKVGGSAESLGAHVTSAVVKSIFIVIVVDGLFAMFYAAIDF